MCLYIWIVYGVLPNCFNLFVSVSDIFVSVNDMFVCINEWIMSSLCVPGLGLSSLRSKSSIQSSAGSSSGKQSDFIRQSVTGSETTEVRPLTTSDVSTLMSAWHLKITGAYERWLHYSHINVEDALICCIVSISKYIIACFRNILYFSHWMDYFSVVEVKPLL